MTSPNLFDDVRELPDEDAARQFSQLIGLDDLKAILVKQARLLLMPDLLAEWSMQTSQHRPTMCQRFQPATSTYHIFWRCRDREDDTRR